jgi:hypothetical protein
MCQSRPQIPFSEVSFSFEDVRLIRRNQCERCRLCHRSEGCDRDRIRFRVGNCFLSRYAPLCFEIRLCFLKDTTVFAKSKCSNFVLGPTSVLVHLHKMSSFSLALSAGSLRVGRNGNSFLFHPSFSASDWTRSRMLHFHPAVHTNPASFIELCQSHSILSYLESMAATMGRPLP